MLKDRPVQDWPVWSRGRALLGAAVVLNVMVGMLILALVSYVIDAGHQAYADQARDTVQDLASIAQEDVSSELSRVDAVLQSTILALEALHQGHREVPDTDLNRALAAHRQLLPATEGLRFADAQGRVHWGNELPGGPDVNVSDRDYFIWAKSHLQGPTFLAGPTLSRISGNWVIALARALVVQDRFRGVVYASVPVAHFERVFSRYGLGRHDAITLRTSSLAVVARFAPGSDVPQEAGSTRVSAELRRALAGSPASGVYVSRAAIDGIDRTAAYREVDGWPLLIVAGIGNDRYFAPWKIQERRIIVLALIAWLLIAACSFALLKAMLRASEHLRALQREARRGQALLRVAGDGIHVVDRSGRLVQMSESFARMLKSTPDRLLGSHVSDWDVNQSRERIDAWLARIKDGDRQLVEVRHRRGDGSIIDVELQLNTTEIDGELLVFGSSRDVTERKRLHAALEQSVQHVNDLYENAPCGYHSVNSGGVLVHANKTLLAWLGDPAEQVLGKARLTDYMDAEGRALFAGSFPRLMAGETLEGIEFRLVPRRAPPRYLRASVTAVMDDDGRFVMSRSATQDISAVRQAQEAMERLVQEQTAMLDNDIVGMVKVRDRIAVWRNRALDRIFGYGPDELVGRSSRLLYPDDAAFEALGAAAYTALKAGLHYRTQLRMRHKDGRLIWIDLTGVNLADDISFWMMVDITAMKEAHERIEHIAFHDALTGLPNRLLLFDRLGQAILAAERPGRRVAVCYLDLDGFKQVNDRSGHDSGDDVLVEVARRLKATLRGNDTAARLGGDEFVVVLTVLEDDDWRSVAERLLNVIAEPIALRDGGAAHVAASIGVALSPDDGVEPSDLLAKADQAMLRAKRKGKGRIETAQASSR